MHSLVLWSGGLDSTYALVRLLRETRDRVLSHHVTLEDEDGAPAPRGAFEAQAVARLRPRIAAATRVFEHSRSRVAQGQPCAGGGAALLAFMAARVALAHGFTPFDRIVVGVNADRDPGWDPDSAACALRRVRLSRAIRAAYGCDETPQVYLFEPRPRRDDMSGYLGPALAGGTVSCLQPVAREAEEGAVLAACGECARCRGREPEEGRTGDVTRSGAGPAARTPLLFRHLVESRSRMPEPRDAAAASDPPAP